MTDAAQLVEVRKTVEQLAAHAKRLQHDSMALAPPAVDPNASCSTEMVVDHPLFGNLRRDGFDVNSLAGALGSC